LDVGAIFTLKYCCCFRNVMLLLFLN